MAKTKQQEKELSIRAYAALLKVDEKTVRNARNGGLLGKGYNSSTGKIIPSLADKSWGATQKAVKPKAGVSRQKAIKKLEAGQAIGSEPQVTSNILSTKPLEEMTAPELLSCISITADMPQVSAMRYREIIALALDKIKLQKEAGLLIEKTKVDAALFVAGTGLKRSLLAIPARVTDDIRAAPSTVDAMNILTTEINEVLRVFSDQHTMQSEIRYT